MDFLKKHYEKILLGVVLVGLAGAVVSMLFVISGEQQRLQDMANSVLHPNVRPLTNLDMTIAEQALKRAATPVSVDLGPPNRLFNPMAWQKSSDGRLLPREKVGPGLLVVSNVQPLYLILIARPGHYLPGFDQLHYRDRTARCADSEPACEETDALHHGPAKQERRLCHDRRQRPPG